MLFMKKNSEFYRQYRRKFHIFLTILLAVAAAITSAPAAAAVFAVAESAGKRKIPIYSVETPEKKIALTFDAAWGADDTDTLLAILENNGVKATFFICGYWVEKYPDDVKKIYEAGHDIANHGATHAHCASLSLPQNKKEIMGAHEKVKELLGIDMNLFRPPYGEYNNTVVQAAEELGYYTIQWSVDSLDWMNRGVQQEISQVLNNKNLKNGAILLFHNGADYTPAALDAIIKGLKLKGYAFVPVSELIYSENYYINNEGRQIPDRSE